MLCSTKKVALLIAGLAVVFSLSGCGDKVEPDVTGMWHATHHQNGMTGAIFIANFGEYGGIVMSPDGSSVGCDYVYRLDGLAVNEIYLNARSSDPQCPDHPPFTFERSAPNVLKYSVKAGDKPQDIELTSLLRPLQEDELKPKKSGLDILGVNAGMEKKEVAKILEKAGYKQDTATAKNVRGRTVEAETIHYANSDYKDIISVAYSDEPSPRTIAVGREWRVDDMLVSDLEATLQEKYGPSLRGYSIYDAQGKNFDLETEAREQCVRHPLLGDVISNFYFSARSGDSFAADVYPNCAMIRQIIEPNATNPDYANIVMIDFVDFDALQNFIWRSLPESELSQVETQFKKLAAAAKP